MKSSNRIRSSRVVEIFRKTTILLFCLVTYGMKGSASLPSPTDSLMRFVKDIYTYNRMFPREQVYLHFDNTGYFMGEIIWFKAYVVSPQGFKPTELSRVLYVELLTPEGRIIRQQKLKIEHGQCHGQIVLDEVLHAGFYEVRAYTALMLNWEDAPVFSRVFPVFNAPKEEGEYDNPRMRKLSHTERLPEMREKAVKTKRLNVTFFPEGGKLVEGLPSTTFFKATDKQGNSQKVQGEVFNQRGESVGTLSTSHDGMGRFVLTPNAGESYYAEVTTEDDTNAQRFDLPVAEKQGVVMSVNNLRDGHTIVKLERSEGTDSTKALGLTVMCRGQVALFKQIDWQGRRSVLIDIPKQTLPEGINQLTLFDTEGRIHAERLCFIFPRQGTKISLVGGKMEGLQPKEPLALNFRVTGKEESPISTIFSLAVRDADAELPTNGEYGCMTANLLLGSELKGYIHNIDYYLEADDPLHRANLDLLLCAQGWRKYNWEEMTRPQEFKVKYPIEEGIIVRGNLTSTFRNREKKGIKIKVFLYNGAGNHLTASTVTDSLGRFAFQAEDFMGRWQMHFLTYENGKQKEMNVNLKKVKMPKGRAYHNEETELFVRQVQTEEAASFQPDTLVTEEEESRLWENLLPSVTIDAQKEWQKAEVRRWHNLIYDMVDERLLMDETGEEYLKSFWEWLMQTNPFFGYMEIGPPMNKITVPAYKSHPIKFRVKYLGTDNGIHQADGWILQPGEFSENGLGGLIENLTVNDVEAIAISDKQDATIAFARDIKRDEDNGIWVLDPTMDPENLDGVHTSLAYVTLFVREDYFRHKEKRGHRKTKIQGYNASYEFYMPDYSSAELPDERDFRRTLYWNPNVKTDADGNASVRFYNSPNCKRIEISTETIMKSNW